MVFIDKVRKSKSVKIFWIGEELFEKAIALFRDSRDQSWSFTDCTSFVLMRELSLMNAFAFDSHFKEVGFSLLP